MILLGLIHLYKPNSTGFLRRNRNIFPRNCPGKNKNKNKCKCIGCIMPVCQSVTCLIYIKTNRDFLFIKYSPIYKHNMSICLHSGLNTIELPFFNMKFNVLYTNHPLLQNCTLKECISLRLYLPRKTSFR